MAAETEETAKRMETGDCELGEFWFSVDRNRSEI